MKIQEVEFEKKEKATDIVLKQSLETLKKAQGDHEFKTSFL